MCRINREHTNKTNDSYHLLHISKGLNAKCVPDNGILVSSSIVSMFPTIHKNYRLAAVRNALNSRSN